MQEKVETLQFSKEKYWDEVSKCISPHSMNQKCSLPVFIVSSC